MAKHPVGSIEIVNGGGVRSQSSGDIKGTFDLLGSAWARRIPIGPWRVSASLAMGRGFLFTGTDLAAVADVADVAAVAGHAVAGELQKASRLTIAGPRTALSPAVIGAESDYPL